MTLRDVVCKAIFDKDPFDEFDTSNYKKQIEGFDGKFKMILDHFDSLLKTNPEEIFVAEIGSWLGYSASIFSKKILSNSSIDACVLCVDTWLGSPNFIWQKDGKRRRQHDMLKIVNGYPTIYYQFLANMKLEGLDKIVVPLPMHSVGASEIAVNKNFEFDVVFIDGDHSYEGASMDISCWWPTLIDGGVMFGDDVGFPGVKRATKEHSEKHGVELKIEDRYWKIVKT